MKKCVLQRSDRGEQNNPKVVDIHAHIVPYVDDGAIDFYMAIDVVRDAYAHGTRSIMCTSHNGYESDEYFNNLHELQEQITKEGLNVRLYSGCEIYCRSDEMYDIVLSLNDNEIPTINGTKYVLIEFSTHVQVSEMVYCIKYLHNFGYKTIIAHVERYKTLYSSMKYMELLKKTGCLFQVNAYSFVDAKDKHLKSFARLLLQEKTISFIGSDTHGTDYRPYEIRNGVDYIYKNCDSKYADDICYVNAQNILNVK